MLWTWRTNASSLCVELLGLHGQHMTDTAATIIYICVTDRHALVSQLRESLSHKLLSSCRHVLRYALWQCSRLMRGLENKGENQWEVVSSILYQQLLSFQPELTGPGREGHAVSNMMISQPLQLERILKKECLFKIVETRRILSYIHKCGFHICPNNTIVSL